VSCDEGHCITCSDEGVPMRVTHAGDGLAICGDGVAVLIDLIGEVAPGDELLVHAGVALVKLS